VIYETPYANVSSLHHRVKSYIARKRQNARLDETG